MGILRRIAGSLSPKASDPLEVAGEGTDPAPDNADNSDIAAKAGGTGVSKRYSGKRARVIKAIIAAVAVIVVCGARYIISGTFPSYLKISQLQVDDASRLPLDDVSMQKYMSDFNEAAEAMEGALSSGSAMRQAFHLHFTPSLEDGQSLPRDPLEIIRDHVTEMQEWEIPSASSPQARRDFAQHLQLLRSICRTVVLRFKDLELFGTVNREFSVANPFLVSGGGEDYSDRDAPIDFEEVTEYDWTASDFLESFQLLGGGGGRPFRTGAFAQAAAQIFRESDATTNYAFIRKLNQIADNWTKEEVVAAAEQQEKENADNAQNRLKTKRELMRRLLRQGIQKDDLVMIALFLL
ncbi:uncharacterized protein EMH_0012390 [Eimeria mitis]|uniref:Uncharacterized protein n=1 Tax=Eimeria mitis TaxID=44415 RepID=U6K6H0_9EIME|nr:uncharacterized protein EMH_0012390 [Eimeria mitis]CDJ32416.1 hypothetical protein EMH_0012390 [Eimeria mitis]